MGVPLLPLANAYRPQTFSAVVGQKHVTAVLRAITKSQRVPPAFVFAGTRGVGKTSTARIFSAALNCEDPKDGDCCTKCVTCKTVLAGESLSVLEIDAASHGLVADIRKLKEMVAYSHDLTWRVVLLDEAHSMSREAFQALLKVLEEPPENTTFILVTTEMDQLPDTVRSRAMTFQFHRVGNEDIVGQLQAICEEQEIDVEGDLLREIATRAGGAMRDAMMLLDQVSRVGIRDVSAFRDLHGIVDCADPLIRAVVAGDIVAAMGVLDSYFYRTGDATGLLTDLASMLRDVLILRTVPDEEAETEGHNIQSLARSVKVEQAARMLRVLWDLQTKPFRVDDRSMMEMAVVVMAEETIDKPIQLKEAATKRPMSREAMVAMMKGASDG